jgi:hypothetical protein
MSISSVATCKDMIMHHTHFFFFWVGYPALHNLCVYHQALSNKFVGGNGNEMRVWHRASGRALYKQKANDVLRMPPDYSRFFRDETKQSTPQSLQSAGSYS